jgi:hypothetical protein
MKVGPVSGADLSTRGCRGPRFPAGHDDVRNWAVINWKWRGAGNGLSLPVWCGRTTSSRSGDAPVRHALDYGRAEEFPLCLVLAVGARDRTRGANWGRYPVDEVALRHGAGVEQETTDAGQAYARFAPRERTRYRDGWIPD